MPFTGDPVFSNAAKVQAHTSFRDLIDSGVGNGLLRVRDSGDVLLAEMTLVKPCGSVNGTTGQLTFDVTNVSDTSADASGTAQYAEFCDSTGAVHLTVAIELSGTPITDRITMNDTAITAGSPVVLNSATVG